MAFCSNTIFVKVETSLLVFSAMNRAGKWSFCAPERKKDEEKNNRSDILSNFQSKRSTVIVRWRLQPTISLPVRYVYIYIYIQKKVGRAGTQEQHTGAISRAIFQPNPDARGPETHLRAGSALAKQLFALAAPFRKHLLVSREILHMHSTSTTTTGAESFLLCVSAWFGRGKSRTIQKRNGYTHTRRGRRAQKSGAQRAAGRSSTHWACLQQSISWASQRASERERSSYEYATSQIRHYLRDAIWGWLRGRKGPDCGGAVCAPKRAAFTARRPQKSKRKSKTAWILMRNLLSKDCRRRFVTQATHEFPYQRYFPHLEWVNSSGARTPIKYSGLKKVH